MNNKLKQQFADTGVSPEIKLPQSIGVTDLMGDTSLVEPPVLIEGLLHRGSMLLLGAGSKSFKSWSLIDLALGVSSGLSWWGQQCYPSRVLYVDFELTSYFWRKRLMAVAEARNIPVPDDIRLLSCRGFSPEAVTLALEAEAKSHPFDLMILDPLYSFLAGRDENAAGDIGAVMEELRAISLKTGCAIVISHHFSKGNQSGKQSIDRFSGSGVFARYPDSLLTMTPHSEQDCYVVEPVLRNFPGREPFVVRWIYPLMTPDFALDPASLKKLGGRPEGTRPEDLLQFLDHPMTSTEWQQAALDIGCGKSAFFEKKKVLQNLGLVTQNKLKLWIKR